MLVDAHCHLTLPQFDSDRDAVIRRAKAEDVHIITSTVDPRESELARRLTQEHDNVSWTLGLTASTLDEAQYEATARLIRKHRRDIVGLGEVGLDYYWVKREEDRTRLRETFARFIQLSTELDLPLVVHSRDAEEDCISMLEEYRKPALLHCFSGTVEQAKDAIGFGCMISIPANITYAKKRQKLAMEIPLGSIVLETDAPYLPPTPKTRNEPANVSVACEEMAKLKKIPREEVASKTSENAKAFFRL